MASFIENLRASSFKPIIRPSELFGRLKTSQDKQREAAVRGTLFVQDNSLENSSERTNMYKDDRIQTFLNEDIYRGYDSLNQILDAYDNATTYDDKINILKQGFENYQNKTDNIIKWFVLAKNLTDYANENGDSPDNVSRTMRHINNFTRNNLYQIL